MDSLMHNPIAEMYGPHFLILYGCVIGVTLLGCWWGVRSRDRTGDLLALPLPKEPDPYEIAYLRGTENEVTRLGVKELTNPDEVDSALKQEGTTLVFVNSVCGCAAAGARPFLVHSAG